MAHSRPPTAATAARRAPAMRRLSVYDGSDRLGRIEVFEDGKARAFDARGRSLGMFANFKAAAGAFKRGDADAT